MFAALEGAEALARRLDALPAGLRAGLEAKAQALAAALVTRVRDDKLSGQVLLTGTGALKSSIAAQVESDGAGVTARVGSFGDVKYAAIQEYGGRTAPHEIVAQKARALAFVAGGAARFARAVAHPGSDLPARAYLGSSLDDARDGVLAEFAGAVAQAWEQT